MEKMDDFSGYPLVNCPIAIENGPVEIVVIFPFIAWWILNHSYVTVHQRVWPFIVDFPIQNGGSFHSYVNLPEGTSY